MGIQAAAEIGLDYTGSYSSKTALAANTPQQVIAPASNVNGVIIISADVVSMASGAPSFFAFLAKTSAPTSVTDGDSLLTDIASSSTNSTAGVYSAWLNEPIKVPAGKGVYYITDYAESVSFRSMLYKVL